MNRSGWINAQDLLSERARLRADVERLRAENQRLRGALVDEVLAEVQDVSEPATDGTPVRGSRRPCTTC
jgi:hypothetical protein